MAKKKKIAIDLLGGYNLFNAFKTFSNDLAQFG